MNMAEMKYRLVNGTKVRLEVHILVIIKIAVILSVTPCSLVEGINSLPSVGTYLPNYKAQFYRRQ
jgi:hypothetical protein